MKIFERYIFKNLLIAALFITVVLSAVIVLTQSIKFLELVINSGADSGVFWLLTLLTLPRFFEIILPLSIMGAALFTYNRLSADSELAAARASGFSPLKLANPSILLALIITVFLLGNTLWLAPKTLSELQLKRQEIKAQFSNLIVREGVFNQAGKGLTVYVHKRENDSGLRGIIIYDGRPENERPSTIIAKRGALSLTEKGFQITVYDGTRQEFDPEKQTLSRLNFQRYTIDIPDNEPIPDRWLQPDERTIGELLSAEIPENDPALQRKFAIELHKRFLSPLSALGFTLVSCAIMLIGPSGRAGQKQKDFHCYHLHFLNSKPANCRRKHRQTKRHRFMDDVRLGPLPHSHRFFLFKPGQRKTAP